MKFSRVLIRILIVAAVAGLPSALMWMRARDAGTERWEADGRNNKVKDGSFSADVSLRDNQAYLLVVPHELEYSAYLYGISFAEKHLRQ